MNFAHNETSGEEGVALFRALRSVQPGLPVLLMTAWAALETAVELVQEGAVDYVEKPWKDEKIVAAISNLLRLRHAELENDRLRSELCLSREALADRHDLRGIIYASEAMHRALSLAVHVAPSTAPILITGPSGCGKERVAEVIQANSPRHDKPFLRVNVGAIPDDLMAAELFGAEAGAYTGQRGSRSGHFEAADGGTLFLDEIDGLSLSGQVKLLRVLQSGEIQRLGTTSGRRVDVRVLSASNARLPEAIASGRFREDLFFRLNGVEVAIPSLASRRDDILPLARHFLATFHAERAADPRGAGPDRLSPEAEGALLRHEWPGNVRELENRIRRATLVAAGEAIAVFDLGLGEIPHHEPGRALDGAAEAERQKILRILAESGGIVAHAAETLGVSRQALYRTMSRLGIELERRPK
jgi:DNA-binding NtrC family response regulator